MLRDQSALLEDTGIAWPNISMWYQARPSFENALSPRMLATTDQEAHAHSPRHKLWEERIQMHAGGVPDPTVAQMWRNHVALVGDSDLASHSVSSNHLTDPFTIDARAIATGPLAATSWESVLGIRQSQAQQM